MTRSSMAGRVPAYDVVHYLPHARAAQRPAGLEYAAGVAMPGGRMIVGMQPPMTHRNGYPSPPQRTAVSPSRIFEQLQEDAERLARKHRGDVAALVNDPLLRVEQFERLSEAELVLRWLNDPATAALKGRRIRGMVEYLPGGAHNVLLCADLLRPEAVRVTVHECGHVRSGQLVGDRSEAAAEAWAQSWRHEATRVRCGLK